MERLRQLWLSIMQRLSVLSLSQRLAIALCAALVGVSFLWLMQWSTTPDMAPLLAKDMDFNQLDAAEKALKANGVKYDVVGNRLFVREADRHNALRLMHAANALPEGSLYDMATVVNDPNPFLSPEAREYAQNYAKGNELAKIISTTPFVKQASVIINPRARRRLGGTPDVPTASVAVTLQDGKEMEDGMVDGLAKLVAGAVAGLQPFNVYVTDSHTGRTYTTPRPDDPASFDILGLEKKRESHLRDKILKKLADIPGVQVAVTVELDSSKRVTQRVKHDPPQAKIETSQNSEQGGGAAAAEPGVQANLGQAVTDNSGGNGTQSNEETKVENFEPQVAQTETVEQIPFASKAVMAAVGIPRSFIVSVFKARNPDQKDPQDDNDKFKAIRDEQVARVKSSVERIVMAKNPTDVVVDVYPDLEWTADGGTWSRAPGGVAALPASTSSAGTMELVRDYGPHVGLAALAVTSLMMMVRLVRRAPLPPPPAALHSAETAAPADEPVLSVGPKPVGKAVISESLLTGRELDDETLRYQELGEEVSKLVEEDPEAAAALIRRWMEVN